MKFERVGNERAGGGRARYGCCGARGVAETLAEGLLGRRGARHIDAPAPGI